MKELIDYIKNYSNLLTKGSVWHSTKELLAPVYGDADKIAEDNYIYEYYCYISIVIDLMHHYDIQFQEGKGAFKYKFPQAAANKKGKPRFNAYKDKVMQFQICAGTKINCQFESEENHPDISFQIASATDDPTESDLILIMDAKYKENPNEDVPKGEVYKFAEIVDLFGLRKIPSTPIQFNVYKDFYGNCLITNGGAYSDEKDIKYLQFKFIKEVAHFFPNDTFKVLG